MSLSMNSGTSSACVRFTGVALAVANLRRVMWLMRVSSLRRPGSKIGTAAWFVQEVQQEPGNIRARMP